MRKIKIFLASSEDLKAETLELSDLVEHLNLILEKQDIHIYLCKWEYLQSKQDYDDTLDSSDLSLVIFGKDFGSYSEEDLKKVYERVCKEGANPQKLYIYFKAGEDQTEALKKFRDSFPEQFGHFTGNFADVNALRADFMLQFQLFQNQNNDKAYCEVKVKDGKVYLNEKEVFIDMMKVPFMGNNKKYTDLINDIVNLKTTLQYLPKDLPVYAQQAALLQEKEKEKEKVEASLWDTALNITRLSNQKCSERLQRAIALFNEGNNEGARAILDTEEIDKDAARYNKDITELRKSIERGQNLLAVKIEGLKTVIEEYRLRIKTLKNDMLDGWLLEIIELCKKVVEHTVTLYGDISVETVEARHELAKAYAANDNYKESEKEYLIVMSNLETIGKLNTLLHAEILRELGELHLTNAMFLKGKPYIVQALGIMEHKYGENHIVFIKALQDISIFYRLMDMFDEAIDSSRRALNLLGRIPESNKSFFNSIRRSLAHAYSQKVKLIKLDDNEYTTEKDKQDSEAALNLFKEIYESEKEDMRASITNLCNLGNFLRYNHGWPLKNNPELLEAVEYYKKAWEIAKEINDKRASKEILQTIGKIYELVDNKEEAEKLGYTYPPSEPKNEKTFTEAYADYQKSQNDIANEIAALYLEKYPRKEFYGVTLSSSEDDSQETFYHELTHEEIEALQEYSKIADEEDITLDEILFSEDSELAEKLLDHYSPMSLDLINSVDLGHPLKFTGFSFHELPHNDKSFFEKNINVGLTDDEFREILVELLLNNNQYSMNMLVYRKPEIAQKIIRHLTFASTHFIFENYNPFVCDMVEQKEICESILNPFKDILELFEHEDESIRKFVERHQIVPEYISNESLFDHEIYSNDDIESLDSYHVLMHFEGRKIRISQEGVTRIHSTYHDIDSFTIDSADILKKFGLNSPEEIFPYLRTNFNSPDCFYRIYKVFHSSSK